MGYELVQCYNTQYAIDWDVVRRLIRSYHTASLQLQYANAAPMSESRWYNPLSWSLPEVWNIEVPWDVVRRYVDIYADDDLRRMQDKAKFQAASVALDLEWMVEQTARKKEAFVDWMGDIQTKNMSAIDQAVKDYDGDIRLARWVRDSSADGLMVGASVMSGGAALAVMGGGSFLKGEAKFQDTGSVGAGVMEGAGSFMFAFVKLGKTFSFKEDMALVMVQSAWKTGTELVGGATLGKAAISGALKLTGPSVDRLFKLGPAKLLFDKVAVPVVITYGGENVASKFLSKLTSTLLQKKGIEDKGKQALLSLGSSSQGAGEATDDVPNEARKRQGQLIAEATLSNKYLLYLAYVNMEKGIGRGW
jgi:hypothetical protein